MMERRGAMLGPAVRSWGVRARECAGAWRDALRALPRNGVCVCARARLVCAARGDGRR